MESKCEITICLGSSCFSRGNRDTVQIIKKYLQDKKLEEKVYFHGGHCYSDCEKGPVLKINDVIYEHVEPSDVVVVLDEALKNIDL